MNITELINLTAFYNYRRTLEHTTHEKTSSRNKEVFIHKELTEYEAKNYFKKLQEYVSRLVTPKYTVWIKEKNDDGETIVYNIPYTVRPQDDVFMLD